MSGGDWRSQSTRDRTDNNDGGNWRTVGRDERRDRKDDRDRGLLRGKLIFHY